MRVLITGTGGFLGGHVVESVMRLTGWDVVSVDSLHAHHNGSIERLLDSLGDVWYENTNELVQVTHDLNVPFSKTQIEKMGSVDYIINVASLCQVDASIKSPVGFILNNVTLMLNMLELARILKPKQFIHVSTDEVYGPTASYAPTDHQPSSPYAASKAAQEDICHSYRRTYGVPVSILNSANMYGERQSQLAFIPRVVKWIAHGEEVPVHYTNADEPGGRYYTYVRNVANHIVEMLDEEAHHVSGLYEFPKRMLLRGQEYVDNHTLVMSIAEIMGAPVKIRRVRGEDERPGYDPSYEGLLASADWKPKIGFDQGLINAVRGLQEDS